MSTLFDVVRLRTFVLLNIDTLYLASFCTAFVFRGALLVLLQIHKKAHLKTDVVANKPSREATAGIFERWTLLWVVTYFRIGWKRTIVMADLGDIEGNDCKVDFTRFEAAWASAGRGRTALLVALCYTFRMQMLAISVPG